MLRLTWLSAERVWRVLLICRLSKPIGFSRRRLLLGIISVVHINQNKNIQMPKENVTTRSLCITRTWTAVHTANVGREKPPFNGYFSTSCTSPMVGNDFVGFNREGRHCDSPFTCQSHVSQLRLFSSACLLPTFPPFNLYPFTWSFINMYAGSGEEQLVMPTTA